MWVQTDLPSLLLGYEQFVYSRRLMYFFEGWFFWQRKIPRTSAAYHLMPIVYQVSLLCAMSATKPLSPSSSTGLRQIGEVGFGRALEADLSLPPPWSSWLKFLLTSRRAELGQCWTLLKIPPVKPAEFIIGAKFSIKPSRDVQKLLAAY